MMRSIFILCLMLQLTRTSYGSEQFADEERHAEILMEDDSNPDNDSSVEELTTGSFETRTDSNPPIVMPTASTFEDLSTPFFIKNVGYEQTEPTVDIPTEMAVEISDPVHEIRAEFPVKQPTGRILNTRPNESIRTYEETFASIFDETTTIPDTEADFNKTVSEIAEEDITTTPKPPRKTTKIYKTRPNELLRHYVQDSHLRSPIAALIDKKRNPLSKAKILWKAALKPNTLLDIMVVSYDSEGIKSTYNLTNTRAMMSTLDRVREENATSEESKTYYSIIRTGQLIPYDSAIFLSTDNLPNDTEHQKPASMILLKKRIRLYLIIFDDKNHVMSHNSTTAERQTGFLGQLALRTGGDVIYVPNQAFRADGVMGLVTLLIDRRLKPIDSELKEVYENELKYDNIEIISEDDEETTSV